MNRDTTDTITINRIEAFSDAVIAIIMTLLVLELKIPEIIEGASASQEFMALAHLLPKFISFAMSFLVIAIFWVNHHSFFNSIHKADTKILWYNNFLLFWLCFIPFPTAWLGENIHNIAAVMLYAFTLMMSALAFQLAVHHAYKSGMFKTHISADEQDRRSRRSYPAIVLYALAIPLALIHPYVAIAIFIALPILYFIPD